MSDPIIFEVAIRNKTVDTQNPRSYSVYSELPDVTGGGVVQILWFTTNPLYNNSEEVFTYTPDFYAFVGRYAGSSLNQGTNISIATFELVKLGSFKNDGTVLLVTENAEDLQLEKVSSSAETGTFMIATSKGILSPNKYVVGLAQKCGDEIRPVAAVELKHPGFDFVFTPKEPIYVSVVPPDADYNVGTVLGSLGERVTVKCKGKQNRMVVEDTAERSLRVIEPYRYTALSEGSWIRTIELFPGAHSTELVCSLSERRILGDRPYEALSWHWGEEKRGSTIKIQDNGVLFLFAVKPTLESALRRLRRPDTSRLLWIDTICIDQENLQEKSSQIQMMTEIYQEAHLVRVWLGEEGNDSALAMSFIQFVQEHIDDSELLFDDRHTREWSALSALLTRPWFGRRWIIQEIALAKQAAMHCGSHEVSWPEFNLFVELVEGHVSTLSEVHGDILPDDKARPWANIPSSGAARLAHVAGEIFEKSDDGTILSRLQSLESLVLKLTAFKASMPHDIIYAILPLAMDVQLNNEASKKPSTQNFPVNYSWTFQQVCQDFINYIIVKSGCIDIICQHWVPKEFNGLPSWIGSLSDGAFEMGPNNEYYRINADSLVGLRGPGKRQYSAGYGANDHTLSWVFGEGGDVKSLFVDGFVLESVQEVQSPALNGCIPLQWTKFVGWEDTSAPPPEPFWKTLVANRDSNGNRAPSYYERLCWYAFRQSGKLDTGDVLDINRLIDSDFSRVVKDYLLRVQSVTWNRRIIMNCPPKLEGWSQLLGLAPAATQVGDL
ncbi:Heterokaryon incompatibility protein 6,OR allele [Lachnellula willkommii]|uniref:Heterokaryon incompatibility protein 6,OR allele n=1 Tax=Lachnellula willkommii TaxID=215461 RepID=A0A559MFR0_9HELO|nr:Heterokaryon incompatibility protein 6,OR allele [Lachnellula willkommii]